MCFSPKFIKHPPVWGLWNWGNLGSTMLYPYFGMIKTHKNTMTPPPVIPSWLLGIGPLACPHPWGLPKMATCFMVCRAAWKKCPENAWRCWWMFIGCNPTWTCSEWGLRTFQWHLGWLWVVVHEETLGFRACDLCYFSLRRSHHEH